MYVPDISRDIPMFVRDARQILRDMPIFKWDTP
jgi:hypothetical protein